MTQRWLMKLREFWQGLTAEETAPSRHDGCSECAASAEKAVLTSGFRGRRRFLHRLSLTFGGVASMLVALPFVGFIFVARREAAETAWRVVGVPDDFPLGETVRVTFVDPSPLPWAGFAARSAAWVRQDEEGNFTALSVYCTHVGCPVRWMADARLFMCPCHGGSFFQNGVVAGGPPRTALDRYEIRVREGQVEILAQPLPLPA